jgi:hypothetical protein
MIDAKSHSITTGTIVIAGMLMAWNSLSMPALAQTRSPESASSEACLLANVAQSRVTQPQVMQPASAAETEPETILILGNIPDAPYVVVIPRADDVTLNTVRQCVPDAFETRSPSGHYIRAGAFARRSEAEQLSRYLRSLRLDARVVYFP